jgi:hypothetical protein
MMPSTKEALEILGEKHEALSRLHMRYCFRARIS